MQGSSRIYVAGHRGLVGSAIVRRLLAQGYEKLLLRTHAELDLTDERATRAFFEAERPEYVFLAAAKVGGIVANNGFPAEFIRDNLAIQTNVIHAAHLAGVQRLLFLGSSCIYPRLAPQPMRERDLLTGPLEPTNRPYAVAKIAGIEMCWSYNRQYGALYLAAMPTNLYGPGDNYHPTNSHVIPALLRKFHEAKAARAPKVTVWGTGTPRREFLYCDDMANACVFLMNLPDDRYKKLLGSDESVSGRFEPPLVNIGVGDDVTIAELAALVAEVVGYKGGIDYDQSKPDGTPRKLMDVSLLHAAGWRARMPLQAGLRVAYAEFASQVTSADTDVKPHPSHTHPHMPALLPTTLITRIEGLLATEVDGETVLMHVEQGQYYGLARTAHVIWEMLATPLTFEQLCAQLTQRYAGAPEQIAADSRRFVEKMAAETLVSLS